MAKKRHFFKFNFRTFCKTPSGLRPGPSLKYKLRLATIFFALVFYILPYRHFVYSRRWYKVTIRPNTVVIVICFLRNAYSSLIRRLVLHFIVRTTLPTDIVGGIDINIWTWSLSWLISRIFIGGQCLAIFSTHFLKKLNVPSLNILRRYLVARTMW